MAIRMARLQGQIFDKLYSPLALKATIEHRQYIMTDLTSEMRRWYDQFTNVGQPNATPPFMG